MRKQSRAWLQRAEEDIYVLSRIELRFAPNNAAVLTQQIIEKLLKALWVELEMYPPMTHDLVELWDTVSSKVRLEFDEMMLATITPYGTTARYPKRQVSLEEAEVATKFCLELAIVLKAWLEARQP